MVIELVSACSRTGKQSQSTDLGSAVYPKQEKQNNHMWTHSSETAQHRRQINE